MGDTYLLLVVVAAVVVAAVGHIHLFHVNYLNGTLHGETMRTFSMVTIAKESAVGSPAPRRGKP